MPCQWSEVAVPGPVEVGDHKLLPLTYGHVVLMERIDLEEVLDPVDYWAFIGICSRPFKAACRWIGFYLSPVGQWLYKHKPLPKDRAKAYSITCGMGAKTSKKMRYTDDAYDILAALVLKDGDRFWYIIPRKEVGTNLTLKLFPNPTSQGRWEKFRHGWDLIC